ncbi:MAG: hypothetical protein KKC03_11245 [Bacteroidetes bacterium]|nr:hypothetical protein [Bacteroidota bacterium]
MQQIYQKKKIARTHLLFGIFWSVLLLLKYIFDSENLSYFDGFYLLVAILYLALAIFQIKIPYLILDKDFIQVNDVLSKKLQVSDIVQASYFAGTYTFKTANQKLNINKDVLEPKDLDTLKETYQKIRNSL